LCAIYHDALDAQGNGGLPALALDDVSWSGWEKLSVQAGSLLPVQVEELAKAKLEKPKRLRQLAAREWKEIDDGTLVFGRPAAEVAVLRTLTKEDLLGFFQVGALLLPRCLCWREMPLDGSTALSIVLSPAGSEDLILI
jgi:hypothetical protein